MEVKETTHRIRYGDWLKRLRNERGITQIQVSESTGIGQTYLSKIENGTVDLPNFEMRERIHAFLGTTEADLVAAGVIWHEGRDWRTGAYPPDQEKIIAQLADEVADVLVLVPQERREGFLVAIKQMAELMRDGTL